MAQYRDKLKDKIVEFTEEDIRIIKEKKLTRRYVPYIAVNQEEIIKKGDITRPQIITPSRKKVDKI